MDRRDRTDELRSDRRQLKLLLSPCSFFPAPDKSPGLKLLERRLASANRNAASFQIINSRDTIFDQSHQKQVKEALQSRLSYRRYLELGAGQRIALVHFMECLFCQ